MKTFKKIISVLISVMLITICCVMAACNKEHVHSYAPEWSSDENYHWHEPLCDDAERILQAHNFKDGKCEVCGKVKEEDPGEQTPGEQTPGEENPGENEPGEQTPGEQTPGEKEPDEKDPSDPGEKDPDEKDPTDPGEKDPDEKDPSDPGEKDPDEKDPSDPSEKDPENPDKDDPTNPNGMIKKEVSDYFEGINFKTLTLDSDKNEAYDLAVTVVRMFELGEGFVGGDMIIANSSGNSMFDYGQEWRMDNMGKSIDEAPADLRVYCEDYFTTGIQYGGSKSFTGRYADMESAYGVVTENSSSVDKYSVEGAAKYIAREGIDNAVYIIDRIAVLLDEESATKSFCRDDDMFYLQLVAQSTVSYGEFLTMTITTTVKVAFYDGLLLALDYSETDDYSGSVNSYVVYSTEFDDDVKMPTTGVTEIDTVPEWLAIPHVGNIDESEIFSDEGMNVLTQDKDEEILRDMCNKFYYSMYYTTGGVSYVGAHGDLDIELKMNGTESKVTVDRTSAIEYLIHKKTTSGDGSFINEQYLDGEYLYEKKTGEDSEEVTRKFEDEYSEDYLEFANGILCEQLLYAMTTYYAAVSNPTGEPEGPTMISPTNITVFNPKGFTIKYKKVDDLIVYKISLSDVEEGKDKTGCTEMDAYYVYDASGKLYAAKMTYKIYEDNEEEVVTEMKLLIGKYSVTVPEEFKEYENAEEGEEPYMDF